MIRTTLLHLLAFTVIGARVAAAQTQITSSAGLSAGNAVFTNPDTAGTVYFGAPTYAVTGLNLTFAAIGDTIEVDKVGQNYFGSAFPDGTTITYAGGYSGAQAPLALFFSNPVSEFGFGAEEFSLGSSTFTFDFFNGATRLGSFSAVGSNSFDPSVPGVLAFLGVRAPMITSVLISDDSENNIGIGPVSYRLATVSTVPEPSTVALAGAGLVGLGLVRCRRRSRPAWS